MGKCADLTPSKKAKISTMLEHCEYTQRQIAELLNVSQSSVRNIKKKLDAKKPIEANRVGRCGRKRITTPRTEREIRRITLENRRKPRHVIQKVLNNCGVQISERTLRRRYVEMGLKCCRPQKKPRLTAVMKAKRLAWAKEHQHWTVEDWKRVCFSDESSIQILQDKSEFVRRRPGEKFNEDCIVERVKHPTSVMIWSVISGKGTGRLYIVQGTMRQDQYKKVLMEILAQQTAEWFPNGNYIFMHDSAPCHKANSITEYLKNNKINTLAWPGNSPDLNPIENVWAVLKTEIAKEKIVTNRTDLIENIIKAWHKTPRLQKVAISCIESMPRRIQAVIAAKGGITKY